jgi:hypothetical protein
MAKHARDLPALPIDANFTLPSRGGRRPSAKEGRDRNRLRSRQRASDPVPIPAGARSDRVDVAGVAPALGANRSLAGEIGSPRATIHHRASTSEWAPGLTGR